MRPSNDSLLASMGYYVEQAKVQREHGHIALESARKDRLAIARQHFRAGLVEIKRAKQEREER